VLLATPFRALATLWVVGKTRGLKEKKNCEREKHPRWKRGRKKVSSGNNNGPRKAAAFFAIAQGKNFEERNSPRKEAGI